MEVAKDAEQRQNGRMKRNSQLATKPKRRPTYGDALKRIDELERALVFYAAGVVIDLRTSEPLRVSDAVRDDLGETARIALYKGKFGKIDGVVKPSKAK